MKLLWIMPLLLLLSACGEQGQVEIESDDEATVLVDGKKKAMTGTNGTVMLTVSAGEHTFSVERLSSDGLKRYTGEKTAFIGANTQSTIRIRTSSTLTVKGEEAKRKEEEAKRKEQERLAKIRAEEERWWNIAAQHNRWANFKDPDPSSPTVKDPLTGLEWMRCSLGQTWTGKTCSGTAKKYYWGRAKQQASDTTYAGNSDWRLPTIDELHSIVYCSSGQRQPVERTASGETVVRNDEWLNGKCEGSYKRPTIQTRLFPNTPKVSYWPESRAHGGDSSWFVYFGLGRGYVDTKGLNSDYHVRLVRSGD